ncbi:acetyl/propionyl/methylcrotonyl-CoA carboxylase subunit alpha [Microlunatus phosphovorus]|nr:biotin carboxylase N-terminal domain-containing protein [Microlunatus phosphovorus]
MPAIGTLLIANRGEIAIRVMRTARRMGIRTAAIYTDLDRAAPHVAAADEACWVPSYLDNEAVIAAARTTKADAIHPGYGFLSERASFAQAVETAGLTLVGPPAAVMEVMGRKDAAREIAAVAGVPVVPRGEDVGYPMLIKAAAGGGGKGMRIVRSPADHDEAATAARREAKAAFGDDTILVEAYIERGRHIEVQILADAHDEVLHLFERDCSSQRRYQKVVEEAPAPTIGPETRELVTSSAVALAKQVGYRNAGTVEFLVDEETGRAYFLEMNTRLQVEHPVTEAITGLDLVELQLRIAAGEPLPISQSEVTVTGHAIEARVYAEDSFHGFLPQAGTASTVRWPTGVRVDHALVSGQVVSTAYDPMLGKIIAYGPDRDSARQRLIAALDRTAILGLTTNTGFLRELVAGDAFAAAEIDTTWLDRHQLALPDDTVPRVLAAWAVAASVSGESWSENPMGGGSCAKSPDPFQADGWRCGGPPAPMIVDLDRPVVVDREAGRVDGLEVHALAVPDGTGDGWLSLEIDGVRQVGLVELTRHGAEVVYRGQRWVFERPDVFSDHAGAADSGAIRAPMPGTIVAVRVAEGELVAVDQVLVVLEAMKMEMPLRAPFAGTVTNLSAATGMPVALGAVLCDIQPLDDIQGADEPQAG